MEANRQKMAGKRKRPGQENVLERKGRVKICLLQESTGEFLCRVFDSEDDRLMATSILVTCKGFVFSNWRLLNFLNAGGYLCDT